MTQDGINKKSLFEIFEKMDDAALQNNKAPQTLCIFGASAVLSYGSTQRQTADIDIWKPASIINDRILQQITEAAGLDYNPMDYNQERPYLQIISEGIVKLPSYNHDTFKWSNGESNEIIWSGEKIRIVAPPASIVAAAKLVRAEPQDIDDIIFIMAAKNITINDIKKAISRFPESARELAQDNAVILDVTIQNAKENYKKNQRKNEGYER